MAVQCAQKVLEEARRMVEQVRAFDRSRRMLPSTYFLLQHNFEDFDELAASSVLPAFSSDVMMRNHPGEEHRIQIPILGPEAHVTYYCLCRTEDRQPLAPVLREITARGL